MNERPNPLAFSGAIELPKGVLSEYQCSFITNQDPKQTTRVKIKDNLSLFTDNGRPNEPTEMNTYNLTRVPLRRFFNSFYFIFKKKTIMYGGGHFSKKLKPKIFQYVMII